MYFFFHDTATPDIYTLSLHDALPISILPSRVFLRASSRRTRERRHPFGAREFQTARERRSIDSSVPAPWRSEKHTSELQSLRHLVCRLLLEKKKKTKRKNNTSIHQV